MVYRLPEEKKDDTVIKANGVVTIPDLDNLTSKALISAIHGKVYFGRKLYCNGIIPITPEKTSSSASPSGGSLSSSAAASPSSSLEAALCSSISHPAAKPLSSTSVTASAGPTTTSSVSPPSADSAGTEPLRSSASSAGPLNKSPSFLAAKETFQVLDFK